ncbi:arginine--tRNA ligase [Candidatus Curculioniphilus buchneri]|uniref:arginine--tRNA ligase n=1 Tax=Candidatus Curculioniphilus buchneri TaxID=690594 RepID=UPI00376F1336
MNIHKFLSNKIYQALITAGAPIHCKAQVKKSAKVQFGDYQVNGVMAIAKQLNIPSYQFAKKVINCLDLNNIAYKIDIVTPGFINIFLDPTWLITHLIDAISSPRLGITTVVPSQTIVVDYSSPNVAKEMHVGHMRSTIIGDVSVRTLSFLGHRVIRANHIGDWGTQFGILIAYWETIKNKNNVMMQICCLEKLYSSAKKKYDEDSVFAERARSYVVKLQSGDVFCLQMWHKLVDLTMAKNQKIYDRLNITLTYQDIMGESLYNNMLADIVSDLKKRGLAVESEGATVVFLDTFKNKDNKPMGVIIQKKDGAYPYITTDIACAKYRYETLKADRILYYVDSRQSQHLKQVSMIVRKAGYVPESVPLEHHIFGMMLDKNAKPFKTRDGGTIKLTMLLDRALEHARHLIVKKNPDIDITELETLARVIGIGAIKYADLSKNRTTDYIFDWNNMLSLEGNTAPYMQYAYARIISVFKHSEQDSESKLIGSMTLEAEQEIKLAVCLLQLEETIMTVARDGTPHILCAYLYDLTVLFSNFYQHCPILYANSSIKRQSRLQLALLTARTLKQGLYLLGIETVERM